MSEPQSDKVIRITKDEALSGHVEDMLKRQMSMRGEPGVTRDRRRSWFYQNWLVFGVVGALGAIVAWAIIEPSFRDMLYLQGPITSLAQPGVPSTDASDGAEVNDPPGNDLTTIVVNDEKIVLTPRTRQIKSSGSYVRLRNNILHQGDPVGVYLENAYGGGREVHIARFIVLSPPEQSPAQEKLSLDQLASHQAAISMLIFPVVAGLIGLFIGAADGIVCRLPRRALFCGAVGLVVGFVGGFIGSILANIVYAPLTQIATGHFHGRAGGMGPLGFAIQVLGRSLAWCLAGTAMGLGQGLALRSKRLLLYGFLGGVVGGMLGGLFFDPIDLILLGSDKPSAALSRLIGFAIIGLTVGAMIGIVELLARGAWLRMTQGPLTGKEFLIFKDVMNVGSSPRSDIYLFNDPLVAENHAIIRGLGDECEIEARQNLSPVLLNNRAVNRARLRHGDIVTIGRASFVFQQRKS